MTSVSDQQPLLPISVGGYCAARNRDERPSSSSSTYVLCEASPVRGAKLPIHGNVPAILGVAESLTHYEKLVFIATNVPYWAVGAWISASQPQPMENTLECLARVCSMAAFHGSMIISLAAVSTYWHGAQCQICPRLYCRAAADVGARLHSIVWLRRLVVADVFCSLLVTGVGVLCFGAQRTFSWLGVPLLFFFIGIVAKRRRQYELYAVAHGLWHCLSALAIGGIVLSGRLPFDGWIATTADALRTRALGSGDRL